MAPPKRPQRRVFEMPPAFTPETATAVEQKVPVDVYAILRDHVAYAAAIRSETRQVRREQQELVMKVSELSSKVDTLISVATDIKRQKDSMGSSSPSGAVGGDTGVAQDDPMVEQLAKRIDDAVAILRGEKSEGSVQLDGLQPSPVNDPNAPVTPAEPSPEALATDINSPQGRDPNAPL